VRDDRAGVTSSHPFHAWGDKLPVTGTAEAIARALPASVWARLAAGEGTKGPRLHDWSYLDLADLEAAEYDDSRSGLWTRGLLIRRSLADGECAYFTTWCPAGTGIAMLVKVEGQRWAIEDAFETAKNELGLDHNETRSPRWSPDHRTSGDGSAGLPAADGTAGTAMSRSSCWPSPCWRRSATTPTPPHPQKSRSGSPGPAKPHPLLGPGTPPHRHAAYPATHPDRLRHCLAGVETGPLSCCAALTA
jgi:hypothetical protein